MLESTTCINSENSTSIQISTPFISQSSNQIISDIDPIPIPSQLNLMQHNLRQSETSTGVHTMQTHSQSGISKPNPKYQL